MGFDAGAITAKLNLDKSGWEASIESIKKNLMDFGKSAMFGNQEVSDSTVKMAAAFVGAYAAMGTALVAMTTKTAAFGEELKNTYEKTGIQVETLSALKLAAEKADVGFGGMVNGLKFLAKFSEAATDSSSEQAATMKRLGVELVDSTGKAKPLTDQLYQMADVFKAMPAGPEKAALAMKVFGRAGMDMIPMLNMGADGLRENAELSERLGVVMSGPAADAADKFEDSMDDLKAAGLGLTMQLGQAFMPVIKSVIDAGINLVIAFRPAIDVFIKSKEAVIALGIAMAMYFTGNIIQAAIAGGGGFIAQIALIPTRCGLALISIKNLATGMAGSLAVFTALIVAGMKLNEVILELSSQQDVLIGQEYRAAEQTKRSIDRFREMAKATGISREEIRALSLKYHDTEDAGLRMEKMLRELAKRFPEVAATIRAKNTVVEKSAELIKALADANTSAMDAIMKGTLSEYNYSVWAIKEKYKQQKEALTKQGADVKDFVQLDKAMQAELTAVHKVEAEKRLDAESKAYDKGVANRKKAYDALFKFEVKESKDVVKLTQSSAATAKNVSAQMTTYFKTAYDNLVKNGDIAAPKVKKTFQNIATAVGQYVQIMQQGFSQFFSALQSLSDNRYKREFAAMDTEYQKKKKAIEDSLMSETEKEAAMVALDAEYANSKKALEKSQFESTKKSNIAQAYINMFAAIVASWRLGWPLGVIAAAISAAACMVQIKAIKAEPAPMAAGGLLTQPTNVIAGEAGPEGIIPLPDLKEMLGVGKGTGRKSIKNYFTIQAWDGNDVVKVVRKHVIPELKRSLNRESLRIPAHAIG